MTNVYYSFMKQVLRRPAEFYLPTALTVEQPVFGDVVIVNFATGAAISHLPN